MVFSVLLIGVSALNLRRPLEKQALVTNHQEQYTRVGGCSKNPGAGMDASKGLVNIYKDGYFHIRCMMDTMESEADYHNAQTREHEYVVKTNVTIVRYTDRVEKEEQRKITPRVCFDFCRTVPEMLYFGLAYGRECYCTPYYHQGTGEGACTAQCEGDASKTCGNTDGMADVYEMHTCGDAVEEAQNSVSASQEAIAYAQEVHENATHTVKGLDSLYEGIDDSTIRHPLMELASTVNKPTMAIERKFTECQELEDTLSSTLSGVSTSSTNAAEVLKVEKEERALKACTDTLKADTKSLKKLVDSQATGEVFGNAGVTRAQLQELGAALMNTFVLNPMTKELAEKIKADNQCDLEDHLGPDCAGALTYNFNAGRATTWLDQYYIHEVSDSPFDEWVEGMRLFCMDMCAENTECNGGFTDYYIWDWSGVLERGFYCGIYKISDDTEEVPIDNYYVSARLTDYDDSYRQGGESFMRKSLAKNLEKNNLAKYRNYIGRR
jgi:hypothetical protein